MVVGSSQKEACHWNMDHSKQEKIEYITQQIVQRGLTQVSNLTGCSKSDNEPLVSAL